jgi:hypothetical protein
MTKVKNILFVHSSIYVASFKDPDESEDEKVLSSINRYSDGSMVWITERGWIAAKNGPRLVLSRQEGYSLIKRRDTFLREKGRLFAARKAAGINCRRNKTCGGS